MKIISMLFLFFISFAASATEWPECLEDNHCPASFSCKNTKCVEKLRDGYCTSDSDCQEGYRCHVSWSQEGFTCRKKPEQKSPWGMEYSCRPVWREPGVVCGCNYPRSGSSSSGRWNGGDW